MALNEDDIYRTSTQFRLWSFTPESLASLRHTTNKSAAERVVSALGQETQVLTPAEELKILTHYTRTLTGWASLLFKLPTAVTATAAMYFRRFYVSNSPMTYHPKDIFPTSLFLATKTENHYIALSHFCKIIQDSASAKPKRSPEQILAPEFLLTQGLRFTFDVRHPFRGLDGGWLELTAFARGDSIVTGSRKSAKDIQQEMKELPVPPPWTDKTKKEHKAVAERAEDRAGHAHDHAKEIIMDAALLTDVYFLYTPSQIWLAAMLIADEPLTMFYLNTKLGDAATDAVLGRIVSTIRACAAVLTAHMDGTAPSAGKKEELLAIDKKLYKCQNPDKQDLVGLNQAKKRGAINGDGNDSDIVPGSATKKRKTETGSDDVFGAALPQRENGAK